MKLAATLPEDERGRRPRERTFRNALRQIRRMVESGGPLSAEEVAAIALAADKAMARADGDIAALRVLAGKPSEAETYVH